MVWRDVIGSLIGGAVVYVVVVACSAGDDVAPAREGPIDAAAEDDAWDVVMDALGDPVADVDAHPALVVTVPCDKTYEYMGTRRYGEHVIAGRSALSLAGTAALVHLGSDLGPPGYPSRGEQVYVRDGAVAAVCGHSSADPGWSVSFVIPP